MKKNMADLLQEIEVRQMGLSQGRHTAKQNGNATRGYIDELTGRIKELNDLQIIIKEEYELLG